jgi:AbrB family looped-hinge helix DNA binding protein
VAKVTSKLQVTLPKALAEQYGVRPGDEIEFQAAGDLIRILPPARRRPMMSKERRLRLFDEATRRQRQREALAAQPAPTDERGWTREELYQRGRAR